MAGQAAPKGRPRRTRLVRGKTPRAPPLAARRREHKCPLAIGQREKACAFLLARRGWRGGFYLATVTPRRVSAPIGRQRSVAARLTAQPRVEPSGSLEMVAPPLPPANSPQKRPPGPPGALPHTQSQTRTRRHQTLLLPLLQSRGIPQPPARYLRIAARLRGAAALLGRRGAEEGVQRLLPDHGCGGAEQAAREAGGE